MYKFICDKEDQIMVVLPKLYARKSKKALVKIQNKSNKLKYYSPETYYNLKDEGEEVVRRSRALSEHPVN